MASGKPLIIAEKPSAAMAIAEALGGFSRREGYLESPNYLLSWAIGHLVEQMAPEDYEGRWKRWSLESLPILPDAFGLKVATRTRSQYEVLARLGRNASELVNACDAGREGELIFRYIYQQVGLRQPFRRLWVSSLTKEAIRKGMAQLRPSEEYDRLYRSALCRAQGDWLIGMNATRAFTIKWGQLLSVGRVQTPTLALLVRREQEIERFVPERYWTVTAQFTTPDRRSYAGKYVGPDGDRLKNRDLAAAVVDRVQGGQGEIESLEEQPVTERPPQLYDLTTLQREANRRFGLTAAATLKATQSLYERKLITYPRTDSRYLSRDMVAALPAILKAVGGLAEFQKQVAGADLTLVHPANRRVINDAGVSDHHAIIPTTETGAPGGAEGKVYGLIVKRFIAQFYPEARFLDLEVITKVGPGPDLFRSRGRTVLAAGWRAVEMEEKEKAKKRTSQKDEPETEEEKVPLPILHQGESVRVKEAELLEKQTNPPRRYTEAALLSAMEFAGKVIDDDALKEAMKGRGLGTPATRASIIERLKDVGYIVAEKKSLVPTEKGRTLIAHAETAGAQVLLSAELTGEWEKRIADIQAGAYTPERFMTEIRDLTMSVVEWTRRARGQAPPPRPNRSAAQPDQAPTAQAGKCPSCGRVVAASSKGWLCVNAECGLRVPRFLCGKVIDEDLASALLTKGRTKLITGFTSPRTGKSFSAFLLLKEGKIAFEFPADRPRKESGYRRNASGGETAERTSTAKTRSRATGDSARPGDSPFNSKRPASPRVDGR